MSFLSTDTKGDVVRNYGRIAQECYGYRVGVIDLRNPTRSDGFNLLHLVNKYMDLFQEHPDNLLYKAQGRAVRQDHLQDHHHGGDGRAEFRAEPVFL